MDCSTPGFAVHHQLPEPTQTQVHWVSDSIQPSHPLSSPSPPSFNLSQHQGLFQWVSSAHQVASGHVHRCESWTIKKAERKGIDAFELWCWRRLLRVPWTARRSNQSILKEINPEYSLKGLMLTLKLQYSGHLMRISDSYFLYHSFAFYLCVTYCDIFYLNLLLLLFLCGCLSF